MHDFQYVNGSLACEQVSVERLVKQYGTPLYIYSQATLEHHFRGLREAMAPVDPLLCYAVKANSNLAVLNVFAKLGSGFDVVSAGELARVITAGGDSTKCVFAGVGKTEEEIAYALEQGIFSFNVESEPEIERIDRIARGLKKVAPISVRANPNVDAHTHAKITTGTYENKFGIAYERIEAVYERVSKLRGIRLRGLQMHIGSQLTEAKPFALAVSRLAPLAQKLKARFGIEFLSLGGGIGIVYRDALQSGRGTWWKRSSASKILTPAVYARRLLPMLKPLGLKIVLEPGRFLVGNAGILVTRVEYVKTTGKKRFVIVDAAMNDLIRPAFYDAYHEVVPVRKQPGKLVSSDVVGGICESGDYFCKDRPLAPARQGDCLALLSAGAYGSVMSSNYNSRPLVAEVLVKGRKSALVRERQPLKNIWDLESLAEWQV